MGRKEIIAVIIGAILGAAIGYGVGQSVLGAVVGAGIVAAGLGLIVLVPFKLWHEIWLFLAEFGQLGEYCLSFVVFSLASIVTLGGLLLWHSLALAALTGVGVMTGLLVVLSAWARSYKDASDAQ